MYYVYVLCSASANKLYIGFSSDLDKRLRSHNEVGKKDWTVQHRPWVLLHFEEFATKAEALSREKQLKGGQGRAWLRNLAANKGLLSA